MTDKELRKVIDPMYRQFMDLKGKDKLARKMLKHKIRGIIRKNNMETMQRSKTHWDIAGLREYRA